MPPAPIRRPITVTIWLLVSAMFVALSPLLLVLAELVAALTRDRRPALATRILLAYFMRELATLLACGAIWLLAGAGTLMATARIQALHWRLLRWFAGGFADRVLRTLEIDVRQEPESREAANALRGAGPVLVLSRHAGPADTILLVGRLLTQFERQPSVVFKEVITLDPSVDLIAHRLPHAVLDTDDPDECAARITHTSSVLGPRGALVLFPEGGNFTEERRRKALSSLRRRRRHDAARAAEQMEHVLPPRPSGSVAALRANPEADVVFAAHTGLGLAAYPLAIWRNLPVGCTLRTRMWLVPRGEIPTEEEDIVAWLTDWWLRLDGWIGEQGKED